jgi:hypothetical protein
MAVVFLGKKKKHPVLGMHGSGPMGPKSGGSE